MCNKGDGLPTFTTSRGPNRHYQSDRERSIVDGGDAQANLLNVPTPGQHGTAHPIRIGRFERIFGQLTDTNPNRFTRISQIPRNNEGLDRRIRDNQIAIRRRQTELSSTPAPLVIDICRINTRHNLGRDTRKREQNAEVRTHTIMGQECKRRRYNGEDAVGSRQGGMEEQETTEQEDNDIIMRDVFPGFSGVDDVLPGPSEPQKIQRKHIMD